MIELTPAEKDEVQMHFLRCWLGRKRRAAFGVAKTVMKKYDVAGNLVGVGDQSFAPRRTTFAQDRERA